MAGPRRRVARVFESIVGVSRWIRSKLASDNDVLVEVDDVVGNENTNADFADMLTIAGVQSRPKDGSSSAGYAHVLRIQQGDVTWVIGSHDPRHVESCKEGELVLHALGKDGSRRSKIVLKPDGTTDIDATQVVIGNPDGSLEKIALGDALENHFNSVKTWMDAHTHTTTATVSTGSPGVIAPPTPSSPSVPTLKSAKHSVEK